MEAPNTDPLPVLRVMSVKEVVEERERDEVRVSLEEREKRGEEESVIVVNEEAEQVKVPAERVMMEDA